MNAKRSLLDNLTPWVSPIGALALLAALYLLGSRFNRADLRLVTFILMWVALASSWNLIGGYAGYVDFGHAVFVGIGGYTAGILVANLAVLTGNPSANLPPAQALPITFIVGALFAGLIGWPTLRLKGPYFSIAMLGTFVAVREIVRNNPFGLTNGGRGINFLPPFAKPLDVFNGMLIITGVIFFVSLWIYRVQLGKMLRALRDDEVGADMRGIQTTLVKIAIFMLAGGFTALVGGMKGWWDAYIDPSTIFPPDYTIDIIMMTMLGGMGRPWGPVIGAVVFYYGRTLIWANASSAGGGSHLALTGILLALVVLFMSGGILSLLDPEDRGLAWFIRHRLLGQKENVFADDHDFEFPPLEVLPAKSTVELRQERNRPLRSESVVLEGRQIIKDFGGLRAVNRVDVQICRGEIVGLLGPNGSGKTTLFNCLSGIARPTSGEVYLQGQRVKSFVPWRINHQGLARTFQRLRVYGQETAYDNLLLARKWKGVPAWLWLWTAPTSVRHKADELLEFLHLVPLHDVRAQNLSGGQQRLLEIGMTLMCDPAVVLLDEATSGVNPALIEDIKDDIRRLNDEQGVTFFVVEHNLHFAMELCDRLYVLDYGTLIAEGTPAEIRSNPKVIEAYFGHDE